MSEFSLEPKNGDYASLVEKKGLYDKKMLETQIRNAMLLQQQKSDKLEKLEQDALNKLKDNKLSINKEIKSLGCGLKYLGSCRYNPCLIFKLMK